MDTEKTKFCCRCNQVKPVSAFGIDMRNADHLNSYCRDCRRQITRARYGGLPHLFARFTDAEIDEEVVRRINSGSTFPLIADRLKEK